MAVQPRYSKSADERLRLEMAEHQRTEKQLHESEERYRSLVAAKPDLQTSETVLRAVLTSLTSHIAVLDGEGTIIAINAAWSSFADENGGSVAKGIGVGANYLAACRDAADTQDPYARAAIKGIESVLKGDLPEFRLEYPCDSPTEKRWFLMLVSPLAENACGAVVSHLEITQQKRAEILVAGEKTVLEMIATGAPLSKTLEMIARNIEAQSNGLYCSILLLDNDGLHLRHGAAPSLPAAFVRALERVAIGPAAGACGTAAYRKAPVIVTDIATDPLCADYAAATLQHGLRACWSTPIQKADGELLGTFAIYSKERRAPAPENLRLIDLATHLAEIAIVRTKTESALKRTYEHLAYLTRTAPLGISVISRQQIVQVWSPGAERILGWTEEEMVGSFKSIVPDGDEEGFAEIVARAFGGETIAGKEIRRRHKDGSLVDLSLWIGPQFGENGEIEGLVGIFADIGERKRAEESFRHANERFELAGQATNDGIWDWDITRDSLWWNANHYVLFGDTPGETPPHFNSWLERIHPEDRVRIETETRDLLDSDEVFWRGGYRYQRKDGSYAEVMDRGYLIRDRAGKAVRMIGALTDISALKRSEEKIRSEAEWNQLILRSMVDGYILADLEGRIIETNESYRRDIGYSEEELAGMNIRDVEAKLSPAEVSKRIESFTKNRSARFETQHRRKDGSMVDFQVSLSLVGEPPNSKVAAFVRNITARKQADQELHRSRQELRLLATRSRSVREKEATRIARELHDELGATLTGLKIDIASIDRRFAQLDETELSEQVRERTARALGMVDSMLQSVRKICLELRPSVLDQLGLATAIEWQANEFEATSGIRCHVVCPEEVSVATETATTVFRILQEILTNVRRHAEADEVHVQLSEERGTIVLAVHDNGRGMSPATLADSDRLGIAGMRERALAAGGSLTIDSAPGAGTTILFEGPAAGPPPLNAHTPEAIR